MQRKATARRNGDTWYVKCPECGRRVELDECPVPGGMVYFAVFCPECETEIEIIPPKEE